MKQPKFNKAHFKSPTYWVKWNYIDYKKLPTVTLSEDNIDVYYTSTNYGYLCAVILKLKNMPSGFKVIDIPFWLTINGEKVHPIIGFNDGTFALHPLHPSDSHSFRYVTNNVISNDINNKPEYHQFKYTPPIITDDMASFNRMFTGGNYEDVNQYKYYGPILRTSESWIDCDAMFHGNAQMVNIPRMNAINCSWSTMPFRYCSNVEYIGLYNVNTDLILSDCTKLSREELVRFFKQGLLNISTTKTLTIGSINLAKLTADDIKIATDKGWTLA